VDSLYEGNFLVMGMDPIWYPRLIRPAEMAMEKKEESRIEENPPRAKACG
jgi:hypothetical protein